MHGTLKMVSASGKLNQSGKTLVSIAERLTPFEPCTSGNVFAATYVSQLGEGQAAKTMKSGFALYAVKNSPSISTPRLKPVRVVAVTRAEQRADVYNISVADTHEYFANGVLVHNCDMMRYAAMYANAHEQLIVGAGNLSAW